MKYVALLRFRSQANIIVVIRAFAGLLNSNRVQCYGSCQVCAPPPFCRWLSCSLQINRCLINTAALIGTVIMSACPCQKPAASEPCTSAVHISTACIVPRGAGHCFRADCYTQIKFPEFDTIVMGTTGSPVCPHQWWGLSRWLCYRAPSA